MVSNFNQIMDNVEALKWQSEHEEEKKGRRGKKAEEIKGGGEKRRRGKKEEGKMGRKEVGRKKGGEKEKCFRNRTQDISLKLYVAIELSLPAIASVARTIDCKYELRVASLTALTVPINLKQIVYIG